KALLVNKQILLKRDQAEGNYKYVDIAKELIKPIEIKNQNKLFSLKNKEQTFHLSKDIYNSFLVNFAKMVYRTYKKHILRKNILKFFKRIKMAKSLLKIYSKKLIFNLVV